MASETIGMLGSNSASIVRHLTHVRAARLGRGAKLQRSEPGDAIDADAI